MFFLGLLSANYLNLLICKYLMDVNAPLMHNGLTKTLPALCNTLKYFCVFYVYIQDKGFRSQSSVYNFEANQKRNIS